MRSWKLLLSANLLGVATAWASVVDIDSAGRYRRWSLVTPDSAIDTNVVNRQTHAIRFYIASDGYSTTNRVAELNAVRACFDQWQAISGTVLKFEDAGLVAPGIDVNTLDNTNVVFWTKTTTMVNGGRDDLTGALGYCFFSFFDNNVMAEADIALNGVQFAWSTEPTAQGSAFFIESVLLHEIGHLLGLEHSPVGGAVMLARGESGTGSPSGLSSDEIEAARTLYGAPALASTLASLKGHVTVNGAGVLGAVVTVEDAAGNVTAGTVTRADGSYQLAALPPASYQVRVTPMDPTTNFPLLVGGDIAPEYMLAEINFLPTDPMAVSSVGGVSATLDFPVAGGSPAFRITRLRPPGTDPAFFVVVNSPISVQVGQSNVIVGVYGSDLPLSGANFAVSGTGVTLGAPTYDNRIFPTLNCISASIQVAPDAAPGMRSLIIRSGANVAYANGFLEVLPQVPDHNFDGLDDNFQRRYFSRWTAPEAGPNADPDQDGFTNLAEYLFGTDPTDPQSYPRIDRVTHSGSKVTLTWKSAPKKHYQVLASPQIDANGWLPLGSTITSAGDTTQYSDAVVPNTVRYYRIQAVP